MTAIIAWIDLMASSEIRVVSASACSARICTAPSMRCAAWSVCGRNSRCRSVANALSSAISVASAVGASFTACFSAMGDVLRQSRRSAASLCLIVTGLPLACQRLQELRIVQRLGDQLLGSVLAIHGSDQAGELGARLEQPAQGLDLARDRLGREVVHALEADVDVHVAFAGDRVRHAER